MVKQQIEWAFVERSLQDPKSHARGGEVAHRR